MSTIAFPFKMRDAESDLADEVDELKRRVAEVEGERDALLEALEVVKAIYELDEKTIRKHGFSFESGEKCSEWAIEKINAAIAKAKGAQE